MVRRVVGVAVGLVVIGALGLALADRYETIPPYPDPGSGTGYRRTRHRVLSHLPPPVFGLGRTATLRTVRSGLLRHAPHVEGRLSAADIPTTYLGEPSRRVSWVVGPNWLVVATNRLAAIRVAMVIGGDLIP
jgi:hypothetical protein